MAIQSWPMPTTTDRTDTLSPRPEPTTPRVLIADDQPDVLEALRLLLKGEGYRIESAGSPAAILDAIRNLPDAYREILILRLVEGMTGPEIAERTGLTHGSVRVTLHRGMHQLRARLNLRPTSHPPEQETL